MSIRPLCNDQLVLDDMESQAKDKLFQQQQVWNSAHQKLTSQYVQWHIRLDNERRKCLNPSDQKTKGTQRCNDPEQYQLWLKEQEIEWQQKTGEIWKWAQQQIADLETKR